MNVTAFARRAGTTAHTVRYYERAGLVPAASRGPNGYREYGDSDLDRMRFVQGCQRLGLKLREIKSLLDIRETGECPCEPAAELMRQRIREIDVEVERLRDLRVALSSIAERIPDGDCPNPTPGTWCREEVTTNVQLSLLRRPAV